ncbi:hypothetical protein [Gracilibacillus kekensis]|uniref:SnoaL-like domain-containing protein n=1 Tax=Gracilibacillus kekensis TaxID=1027249 RepID=A0A1M7QFS8_9BACI|nr:hypothetical protein [Gracilibacillus kekensis]SHN29890.1 hypothetical protein SAMN05216179_3113 [Gracilibacillus kekensis]
MSYAEIKTKTVEKVISEEQFYTLKESLVQSYLFMDEFNKQEVKELLLYVFNINEQELIERSSSFLKHKSERATQTFTIEIAEQWVEKSNIKDIPSLLGLTHTNIEIIGPKGSVSGSHHLADWLDRANLKLVTVNRFAKGHDIVLEQKGTWYEDNGEIRGQATVYTYMRVTGGKVAFIARYDNKIEAFHMSGLNEENIIN